jgi:hypothetical protein
MTMKGYGIHLKSGYRQEHDTQLALDAQEIFAARPGRRAT